MLYTDHLSASAGSPRHPVMHIVLVSVPLEGHLPPIAALGQGLLEQGHKVQVWTAPQGRGTLERLAPGCKHCEFPYPYTPEEEARLLSTPPPQTPWDAHKLHATVFGVDHHRHPFRCLDESVTASRPDLIIADFLTWGAWDVAEKHKIPLVIAVTCSAGVAINFLGAYKLWRGFRTAAEGAFIPAFAQPSYERMSWARRLVINPLLKMYFPLAWRLWAEPIWAHTRKSHGLPPVTLFRGSSPHTLPPHMVLTMTVPGLDHPVTLPPHWRVSSIVTRNFSQAPPALPEGDEIRSWLEAAQAAGDHVVYVAMGSVALPTEKQVLAMSTAFLALSNSAATLGITFPPVEGSSRGAGVRCLWSIKDAAAKHLPKGLPQDKILTRPWVAQPSILAHPAVSMFITHAGLNSLMEALAVGKPLFALPCGADQFLNTQHLRDKGVGEGVPASQMTAASIMDGVSRVLRDPGYRRRAEGIRDCIRAAPGLQQALTWIQDFAKGAAGSH